MATTGEHKRACFGCGNVAMHAKNWGEDVRCERCGSMDTRPVRKKPSEFPESLDQSHRGSIEIVSVMGRARITIRDAKHSISIDVGREGLTRLVAELQAVLEGGV